MLIYILGFMIGVLIFIGGIYYLLKEKNDQESRKIYSIASIVGIVVIIWAIFQFMN